MDGFSVDTDSLGRAGQRVQTAGEQLPRSAPALDAAGRALPGGVAERRLPDLGVAIDSWVSAWLQATASLGSAFSLSSTGYAVSQERAAEAYHRAGQAASDPRSRP
ncbi:MAG: hypothetical protein IPM08_07660 [Actinomycetales bacterium]|nr:hypothetical protein [Actinomycetales bacterium]